MTMKSECLLLKEFYDLNDFIKENKTSQNTVFIEGIIQRADKKNQNGRIYPRKVLEKAIDSYKTKIKDNRSAGEANHPNSVDIDLLKISHIIKDVWWQGDDLYGRLQITTNSVGKDIQALINDGLMLGVSSRGYGSVSKKDEDIIVNDDYELVCFDLVHDPSTTGAFALREGVYRKIEENELFTESNKGIKNSNNLNKLVEQILSIHKR